jgi:hypothetical protein
MRFGTGEAELHGEPRPAGPALRWEVKGRRNAAFPTDGRGQLASASGAHITALVRNAPASRELMGHLGATAVEQLSGDFDVIIDCGGATFGLAIEHVARAVSW